MKVKYKGYGRNSFHHILVTSLAIEMNEFRSRRHIRFWSNKISLHFSDYTSKPWNGHKFHLNSLITVPNFLKVITKVSNELWAALWLALHFDLNFLFAFGHEKRCPCDVWSADHCTENPLYCQNDAKRTSYEWVRPIHIFEKLYCFATISGIQ